MRRPLSLGVAGVAVAGVVRALAGIGRSLRPLGPLPWTIAAPSEIVFAEPYLGRTTRALEKKLQVWERGRDTVLAAHFTPLPTGVATTVETVRFERPSRVDFRLVRGPVPHVSESFESTAHGTNRAGSTVATRSSLDRSRTRAAFPRD